MSETNSKLEWLLRIGVAGEFIGHGLLAIEGKKEWIAWISQMIHTSNETSASFLLLIGILDSIVALMVLVQPVRPVLLWAAFWGFWTALVRPLVGQSGLDFIERSANWAAPLALFCFYQGNQNKKRKADLTYSDMRPVENPHRSSVQTGGPVPAIVQKAPLG